MLRIVLNSCSSAEALPATFILRQVEGDGDSELMEARLVGTELLTQTLVLAALGEQMKD